MFTCAFQVSPAPTPSGGERPAVAQPPASALEGAARARSASGMSSLFMRNNLLVVVRPTPAAAAAFRQRIDRAMRSASSFEISASRRKVTPSISYTSAFPTSLKGSSRAVLG